MTKEFPIIDTQYFPSIAWWAEIASQDSIALEKHEFFEKQTYRNRCHILGPNNIVRLTVPVIGAQKKIKTKDIKIDNSQRWQAIHERSIQASYGKSPFYDHYIDYLLPFFQKQYNYLWDLNLDTLTTCRDLLGLSVKLEETSFYSKNHPYDLRSLISPKKPLEDSLKYKSKSYFQCFGNKFESNLSVLDLIFCEGPNAISYIKEH
ncbi:WbqC family protein [Marinigracilibium pacificum]|uniref:WbqC family protein n=1 Tax=Marinigracilibium pacificum TaxID=2729599 RepID=A0A848IWP6_9BACT|nr:WbqC family protein [Marinigracilibium pacificum]NMM48747.1 WbqC family protein [Marinigracilibium pacificum]